MIAQQASVQLEGFSAPATDDGWEQSAARMGEQLERALPPDADALLVLDSFEAAQYAERYQELWPVLGRPGAVLADGELVGVWRPRTSGRALTVAVRPWRTLSPATREAIGEQAERLAAYRGVALHAVDVSGGR